MEECKSLKSTMQKKKKEAEGHLAEYNEFKHSRRMLSVVRMLVETSEEAMKCLVEASPDYGRFSKKERECPYSSECGKGRWPKEPARQSQWLQARKDR